MSDPNPTDRGIDGRAAYPHPRIGSLCSGYGGLELGLITALGGGEVAWHAEFDPDAARVLAANAPDVPNLGDITAIDWSRIEPVDWLCAGFPCQPASAAGRRKGMDDERWLWDAVATAVARVRPRRVLLENVTGLLSVDRGRAFERVVCDLAALGYVGRFGVVRAADAGAPHARARVFVDAADAESDRQGARRGPSETAGGRTADAARRRAEPLADATRDGWDEGRAEPAWRLRGSDAAERGPVAPNSCRARLGEQPGGSSTKEAGAIAGNEPAGDRGSRPAVEWGPYRPAIERWELVTGRPAPRPTAETRRGERLNPRFVEWLMGLRAGWVTDVPMSRNAHLRLLGNGVVPQQAALAVSVLSHNAVVAA